MVKTVFMEATNVQSGELIEFENGLRAIVLNLEEDNVERAFRTVKRN